MEKQHYDRLSDFSLKLPPKPGTVYQYPNQFAWRLAMKNHPPNAIAVTARWLIIVED